MKLTHPISLTIGIAVGIAAGQLFDQPSPGVGSRDSGSDDPVADRHVLTSILPHDVAKDNTHQPVGRGVLSGDFLTGPAADAATIDAFLERHKHSREALVAAASLSDDTAHLIKAAELYPDDPQVQLLVISNNLFPEEKSAWLERFKASQPDNALASLLMGGDLLARGDTGAGLAELRLAGSQTRFEDFSSDSMLAMESALMDLGLPPLETKLRSTFGYEMPQLSLERGAMRSLHALAEGAGSPEERAGLATLGVTLGNHLSQGQASLQMINQLVGISTESQFLQMLDPDTVPPGFDQTPGSMLVEIQAQTAEIRAAAALSERLFELSEPQLTHYLDRVRSSGELDANRWLREQLGAAE